ncbi:MAG TPA: response regulator [bacterium]|jgi:CheY-like chemotaxis protein
MNSPSALRPALIIDDNDEYAAMLLSHFEPHGFQFIRATNAKEGLQALRQSGPSIFKAIITDITMGSQTAGLKLIRKIRKLRYHGVLIVASTGFDSPFVLQIAKPAMIMLGADILIPKRPLKAGQLKCHAITVRGKFWKATYLS